MSGASGLVSYGAYCGSGNSVSLSIVSACIRGEYAFHLIFLRFLFICDNGVSQNTVV